MNEATQNAYNITKQPIRNRHIKIDLLNFNFQTVDEISGNVISGSRNTDANSDIRNTFNISIVVTDSSFEIQPGGKIFLDKYIHPYVGEDNIRTGETEWISQGIYLIDAPSWNYDATTNTLSFKGLDLMSKLTGLRNGYLEGIPTLISQGNNVREAMISTITQLGKFNKYIISECMQSDGTIQSVPYDIKIEQGGTIYDILNELNMIIPNYEIFFRDDVFIYQPIPTGENEPISIDDDIWNNVVLSENINTDFSSVKNIVEVYGKSLNPKHYNVATVSGNNYAVSYAGVTSFTDNVLYGFTASSIITNPYLKVNNLGALPIVDESGASAVIPKANEYYVVTYQASKNNFLFLGYQQPYGISKDINPDSPFYINSEVGEIRIVLYGGEYDNIQSNSLAQERSDYELWLRTRMNDSITLTCVPIFWADVNIVVNYTPKNSTVPIPYIIKSISTDYNVTGTQTIQMIRYYPLYTKI